jgi:ketosteroid isomerase-like protein
MKKYMFFLWLLPVSLQVRAQSADEAMIRQLLDKQTQAWNNGQIEEFMHGYWENDSLMFIGKSGITYSYSKTLANYKKGYPDTAAMGKLSFTILEVKRLSDEYYYVIGKWFLKRSIGDVGGHYTLLFRKIRGQWVIVADHTS